MKYLYKIGNIETYVYNDIINEFADNCGGKLTTELIHRAIDTIRPQVGELFEVHFDELALLLHFMEREGVDTVEVIEKTPTRF